ncbi:ATP-binding protein [Thalassotalea profundi]|uniref:histidine kinase n=1 Tax=Thalassotalea profundi TaxID=2036687 RepID=A0ABQ3J2E4_9GAMM|nr:ATP-binding protein [Thalassotalea profundi]GHF01955.1 two-component sensor histidine kinase [Thalassotalea profundi]
MTVNAHLWQQFNPRFSSVWRLTLAFATITSVVLVLCVVFIYQLLLGEQTRQVERRLNAEQIRIEGLANKFDKTSFFQQLAVFRDEGDILIFWQSEDEQFQQLSFLPNDIPKLPNTLEFPVLDTQRKQIRLLTTGIVNTQHGDIVIATATEYLSHLISEFKTIATWACLVSLLLTCVFGYIFARRHLRRVNYFNNVVEQVQKGDLSARIAHKKQGDEFVKLAKNINTMLDTVEENFALVQGITDNIAHDLKTPLTRLRLKLEHQAEQQPELGLEIEQLDTVLHTFDAMLKLTRLEHGQFPLTLELINCQTLVNDLIDILEPSAQQNNQQIKVINQNDFTLQSDKNLLFQALFNLIENAIKYAGNGATIQIELTGHSINIRDNGKGVAPAQLSQLTKRFYRGDPARQKEGFGLGLAIVKAICDRHQFILTLTSDEYGFISTISINEHSHRV